ncbi:MAG: aldehyde dehydrogenase family protein [Calditrichia bacterium]
MSQQPQNINNTPHDIEHIFQKQLAFAPKVKQSSYRERKAKLKNLLKWIYANQPRIHAALAADFRKPEAEVDLTEIFVVTSELKHTVRHLRYWMYPDYVAPNLALLTTRSKILYEPKGTVLIISPWNYPFNLTVSPLVSAIAAGNTVMIKPSELSPNTSQLLQEMVSELFQEEEVALFQGGVDVSTELLKQPFHHIFFTGSPRVGKIVMEAASKNLSGVTLELGGKSPAIVDKSANLKDAAAKLVWGKFSNCGQTCIAPDYVLVDKAVIEKLGNELQLAVQAAYGKTAEQREASPDYARIISQRHLNRLLDMLAESLDSNARLLIGGDSSANDRYFSPTILTDVPNDSRLMQEEIFGPILPVIAYQDLNEALSIINSREKPLALYIFSKNRKVTNRLLAETTAGGTGVNEVLLQFAHPNLPFGGINNSGLGNSHGFYGFRAFSHERPVLRHNALSPLKLLMPPYSKTVRKLTKLVARFL